MENLIRYLSHRFGLEIHCSTCWCLIYIYIYHDWVDQIKKKKKRKKLNNLTKGLKILYTKRANAFNCVRFGYFIRTSVVYAVQTCTRATLGRRLDGKQLKRGPHVTPPRMTSIFVFPYKSFVDSFVRSLSYLYYSNTRFNGHTIRA